VIKRACIPTTLNGVARCNVTCAFSVLVKTLHYYPATTASTFSTTVAASNQFSGEEGGRVEQWKISNLTAKQP
jgi:hypothetical protein